MFLVLKRRMPKPRFRPGRKFPSAASAPGVPPLDWASVSCSTDSPKTSETSKCCTHWFSTATFP